MKTVKIKGKDYVMVVERIKFLRDNHPGYSINTKAKLHGDVWVVSAKLTIPERGTYTGWAGEVIGDGMINKSSALENCETSAIGRACANAGIGVIDDIASAEEVIQAGDITDGQIHYIESLLHTSTIEDEMHSRIENSYLTYSFSQAKKCINYLKENQKNFYTEGTGSAKQIKEAVEAKLNDPKA